ncbi:MAG: hypothetical protein DRI30_08135 [Chloroflexi bacterium]|nr:MAG: hypothetical protein DRI30_08135 [Chloroflexota bacterium]
MRLVCKIVLVSICLATSPRLIAESSIEGVWEISKIVWDVEATTNSEPLPSLMIFTSAHYSFVWMPDETAIEAFETRWQPTDREKLQRFDELVVNTGSYEISNEKIRVTPTIARMPEFMGGLMVYGFEWSGDDLVLTLLEEYTFDGVSAPWVEESSGKIHLTLSRVSD